MDSIPIRYLLTSVLPHFQIGSEARCQPVSDTPESPLAGGLSSGSVWQISSDRGMFALRLFGPSASASRILASQSIVTLAGSRGYPVPVPHTTRTGDSLLEINGHYWELLPWLAGRSLDPNMSLLDPLWWPRLELAMATLGRWHETSRDSSNSKLIEVLTPFETREHLAAFANRQTTVPPGLLKRKREWQAWCEWLHERRNLQMLFDAAQPSRSLPANALLLPGHTDPLNTANSRSDLIARTLALTTRLRSVMEGWLAGCPAECELVITHGDLHHEHLLFEGEHLSGWIDWESPRLDTRGADLGRLLGSLFPTADEGWSRTLAAYRRVAPLSEAEARQAVLFDRSGTLLAILRWMRWLTLEPQASQHPEGESRWQFLLERAENWPEFTGAER